MKVRLILYSVRDEMEQDYTRMPSQLESIRKSMEGFQKFSGIEWE